MQRCIMLSLILLYRASRACLVAVSIMVEAFASSVGRSDENGWKNLISTTVSIFFGGNGIGFGKYGYGNGIGLRGKYGR